MDVQLRPARAEDAAEAGPLIYSSGPAVFDYIFRHPPCGPVLEFLRRAFVGGAGELGFRAHTVAVTENKIIGIGAAFSGESGLAFMLAAARQIFSFYDWRHSLSVIRRGLQVEPLIPLPTGGLHYITHVGIAPAWQGRGVGTLLVERLLAQGRAVGRAVAALDVAVTNPRAQALYERLGFVVTRERAAARQPAPIAPHRRMERSL